MPLEHASDHVLQTGESHLFQVFTGPFTSSAAAADHDDLAGLFNLRQSNRQISEPDMPGSRDHAGGHFLVLADIDDVQLLAVHQAALDLCGCYRIQAMEPPPSEVSFY